MATDDWQPARLEPEHPPEDETEGALREERRRHRRDSRRPGHAGAAAAQRERLTKELDGLRRALALTPHLPGDAEDGAAREPDRRALRGRILRFPV